MGTRISRPSRARRRRPLEPRKRPVQTRSLATVDALLEAAAQVFEREGYAAGTTNRIAERAGVSIGTLYQYFPNKESLALQLLERHIEGAAERLGRLLQQVRVERPHLPRALRLFVETLLELHADQPRLQHVLLEEVPRSARVEERLRRTELAIARAVAELLRSYPEVAHPELERAAYLSVHAVEDLTHRFVAHPPAGLSRGAFADELVQMLEAYLTRRPRSHRR